MYSTGQEYATEDTSEKLPKKMSSGRNFYKVAIALKLQPNYF
jgi:hypothetical protein